MTCALLTIYLFLYLCTIVLTGNNYYIYHMQQVAQPFKNASSSRNAYASFFRTCSTSSLLLHRLPKEPNPIMRSISGFSAP